MVPSRIKVGPPTTLILMYAHKESLRLFLAVVDLAFGTGLLTFDEVCKKVEAMAIRDEDELRTAYVDCQVYHASFQIITDP